MKIYAQAEFDALPIIDGWRRCPAGDYSALCSFGERCSFGEGCRFGEWCSFDAGCRFGEWCSFGEGCRFDGLSMRPGNPYIAFDRFGSELRKTYFFNAETGIHVRAGCFFGTLAEFKAKVLEDVPADSLKARQYFACCDLAELTFGVPA